MNEEPEIQPARETLSRCPGLSAELNWDAPAFLRGELYTEIPLAAHAAELARAHDLPVTSNLPGRLRRQFNVTRERIQEAYQVLAREAQTRREPTPAQEWLLDNANVVHDQIREIAEDLPFGYLIELPRIGHGKMRGYPRVYGLCIDYLRHTDARVDPHTLASFVSAYQSVARLTIGELWAVPIMLRLGLLMVVETLAATEASTNDRAKADQWADRVLESGTSPSDVGARLSELERSRQPLTAIFLVQLLRRLREHETSQDLARDWVAAQCRALGTTPEDLTRREHLRQAADQVTVGNAITSMRTVSALDWDAFFERTSEVEATLRKDPSNAYPSCDKNTRDRYRHAVEDLARRSKLDEVPVAQLCVELASQAAAGAAEAHVGYYLVDAGRPELERRVAYRPKLARRFVRAVLGHPHAFYFGSLAALTLGLSWGVATFLSGSVGAGWLGLALALFLLPLSDISLSLVSSCVVAILPPRLLGKFDFEHGIPDAHRTLVAVPVLLDGAAALSDLVEHLEVRSLANSDPNLYFALLTDFTDADTEESAGDAALLVLALEKIRALNERRGRGEHRYWLLHRRRTFNAQERRFMGWERKRGKLEELNRLLRGDEQTTFSVVTAPAELLSSIQYVITLDADTDLPRDVAHRLVGTLAHPLNRPRFEPDGQRLLRGHAIVQPRVGTLPASSRQSRFAAIAAGPSGIDPYTTAISDVYQDLFDAGSFVGKGIYDVDSFSRALAARVPENHLLSHDLFEGIFARAALATDIEVLDEQPAAYDVQSARQHRWVRGDWQLLPWLMPRVPSARGTRTNDLGLLGCWKIADNLRRSLLPIALVALLALGCLHGARVAAAAVAGVLGVFLVPLASRLVLSFVRESSRPSRPFLGSLGGDLRTNLPQVLLTWVFLLDQAWTCADAILRTLYRLVSKRRLLEWTTMQQAASQRFSVRQWVQRRLWISSGSCLLALVWLAVSAPGALPFAVPVLALWAAAPLVAQWLSAAPAAHKLEPQFTSADRRLLRLTARKTWRFFTTFVTAKDNFLPPDNFQEEPRAVVAHRTSPTNIGLYLMSVASARDLAYIGLRETTERLEQTLSTLERLEKREGHVLNWYDTTTLRPLEPQYVSTVDSGNLAAYLWTLRETCDDFAAAPIASLAVFDAARDALRLTLDSLKDARPKLRGEARRALRAVEAKLGALAQAFAAPQATGADPLEEAAALVASCRATRWGRALDGDAVYWLEQSELAFSRALAERAELLPFLNLLQTSALFSQPCLRAEVLELRQRMYRLQSLRDVANVRLEASQIDEALEQAFRSRKLDAEQHRSCTRELGELIASVQLAGRSAGDMIQRLNELGARATALADGMNFRFLFDEQRELFSIGYNVSNSRLDANHYDLLASEARLAGLVAIAKGDAPQEHWFRLGRPRARVAKRRALLSWSGSMFEYLMPLLCTKNNPQTLLDEAYEAAIERQIEYGRAQGVPWGISECAYNVMDLSMTYQYRAFGVPGLGLKVGLGDDLVIAPYATLLAGLVRPDAICRNLRALQKEGAEGVYGFYEAVDFTPEHVPPGRRGIVVKAYFAHHQGMSLVALSSVLNGAALQRRFHRDARIKATELVLEERIPTRAPLVSTEPAMISKTGRSEPSIDVPDHVGLHSPGPLRVHLLGHGELSSLISATGTGVTCWKGLDVNRFREDPVLDSGGIYLYVRNLSQGRTWSAAYQPTRAEPDFYDATFLTDRVEFHRRDGDIQTLTEIALSPEHATEVRRITLTNHGGDSVAMDVTTYTEVVLMGRGGDVAHRAFASMFVETEAIPERHALLAKRRPRAAGEPEVWMVQVLSAEGSGWGALDYDTSRLHFLGRGRGLDNPEALQALGGLAKRTGNVLDPAFALRRAVELAPHSFARLTLTTGLASSREEALALLQTYAEQNSIARAIELGWAGVRVELRHLGITAADFHRFQRLLSAVVFPHSALRAGIEHLSTTSRGKAALWAQGISGDLPIVLVRVDDPEFTDLCREVLLAHEYWRLNGFSADLVILNEEPSGYLQPTQDKVRDLMRQAKLDQRGGVFLRRADQMSEEDRELLLCAARVVLRASQGSLARQLRRALALALRLPAELVVNKPPSAEPRAKPPERPKLAFDNGLGGFSEDGREYVLALAPGSKTPNPWCNVIANPSFGTLVTESGSSFTWFSNSQRHRLTPWSNDAVCDPSGEVIYVRDDEDGTFWTATPEPCGFDAPYTVAHGQGYSRFEHARRGLAQELTLFVSPTDSVKLMRLRIDNQSGRARRLSLFGVVDWVLGSSRESSRVTLTTAWHAERRVLLAANPFSLFPLARAFFGASVPATAASGDREEFYGAASSARTPTALSRATLSGRTGPGLDACGALHVSLRLAPNERAEVTFVLGHAESAEHALALSEQYTKPQAAAATLEAARRHWDDVLGAVTLHTPDRALDLLHNRWLLYQALSARIWARSGFYQSSGAYGFRDQLQDVLSLLHTRPDLARAHILRCAARQFVEGDVQHWWHTETGDGVRTFCSDDMLWLPFVVAEYVRVTGDRGVLDEALPFLVERALSHDETDLFSTPAVSEERASLYEHCTRALDAGATSGPHGLPLMRDGDWNDGMNRVGKAGRGESVWLAWFLARTLKDFLPLALGRGDRARMAWCNEQVSRLARAADKHAWDGEWYLRAYFDDGTPLGSHTNSECSIDAIAQSWSVIAGVGDAERASQALRSSLARLFDARVQFMRLLDPPFREQLPDPGYIRAYPAGVRENGGQYTHGVLWTILALALEHDGDRAGALLSALNPINHTDRADILQTYRVEPYVVAADVYSHPEHLGRGGWTWYTGAAGWLYRIVLEAIVGLRRRGNTLAIVPCIPSHWPGFEVVYRHGSASYHIAVNNPLHVSRGVVRLVVDGKRASDGYVRLVDDGHEHRVDVTLGHGELETALEEEARSDAG